VAGWAIKAGWIKIHAADITEEAIAIRRHENGLVGADTAIKAGELLPL